MLGRGKRRGDGGHGRDGERRPAAPPTFASVTATEEAAAPRAAGRYFCAVASDERAEPLHATASRVQRWVLVEQDGPWGPESLPSSRLDAGVQARLAQRVRAAGGRVLLIRRPDGATRGRRTVVVSDVRPGHERTLTTTVATDAALDALTFPWHGPYDEAAWSVPAEPLLLVCTQGRHDPCCAVRGRPVAKALAERRPDSTWECSHLGGDRFAANLLVLPQGVYLGRVTAADADAVLQALADGRVPARWFRGRTAFPPVVQAAQHLAAERTGADRLADLRPRGREEALGDDRWRVHLAGEDGAPPWVVDLQRSSGPQADRLTCGAAQASHPPVYRLLDLRPAA